MSSSQQVDVVVECSSSTTLEQAKSYVKSYVKLDFKKYFFTNIKTF